MSESLDVTRMSIVRCYKCRKPLSMTCLCKACNLEATSEKKPNEEVE